MKKSTNIDNKTSLVSMGTIQVNGNSVNAELSVYLYKDESYPNGDMYIAYCPELDLTGYDVTKAGAKNSFEVVLKDYLEDTIKNNTLEEDLLAHGWTKKKGCISGPTYPSMLKKSQLVNVLRQKKFSKYSKPLCV